LGKLFTPMCLCQAV